MEHVRMNRRLLCKLLAACLAASGVALCGTTGKIAGDVKDARTGEAIVGASVKIDGTPLGAATNVDHTRVAR